MIAGKKMGRTLEYPKKTVQCNMYIKDGLWLPTVLQSLLRETEEGIIIYTGLQTQDKKITLCKVPLIPWELKQIKQ